MHQLPFGRSGQFYRGNLHTHSSISDGRMSPEQVIQIYRDQGYDFVAITDHFTEKYGFPITDTVPMRDSGFTTLLGAELHTPVLKSGAPWHIVAVGLPADFAPTTPDESGPELAARAAEAGAFVGLAHPAWYGLTLDEALSVESAHAVEIYNETCALSNDRGESWYVMDLLLSEGRRLSAFGSDDAHLKHEAYPDACAAWVWVHAEQLHPDDLLAALKAGHYYTSQGPLIHDIRFDDREILIRCSPAASIYLTGHAQRSQQKHGRGLTEARFPLDLFAGSYCRVTVVDSAGKRAWSNPIWLDD